MSDGKGDRIQAELRAYDEAKDGDVVAVHDVKAFEAALVERGSKPVLQACNLCKGTGKMLYNWSGSPDYPSRYNICPRCNGDGRVYAGRENPDGLLKVEIYTMTAAGLECDQAPVDG